VDPCKIRQKLHTALFSQKIGIAPALSLGMKGLPEELTSMRIIQSLEI
jgi:hypothetical protein